jgi:hypothetical protein
MTPPFALRKKPSWSLRASVYAPFTAPKSCCSAVAA